MPRRGAGEVEPGRGRYASRSCGATSRPPFCDGLHPVTGRSPVESGPESAHEMRPWGCKRRQDALSRDDAHTGLPESA